MNCLGADRLTLPQGYRYSALYAGIRKTSSPDLGLIVSDLPASAAGVFTRNLAQAAPVKLARAHLERSHGTARAIIVNAGNANCATRTGDATARASVKAVAQALDISPTRVLPASTGVIGVELDATLITRHVPALVELLSPGRFEDVARAMMTTDTAMKTAAEEAQLRGGRIAVAGMTKGAGMIHPNMATTLCFVLTDAVLSPADVQAMLREGIETSFNRLSVDGDTSTNDTALLLANGASGAAPARSERRMIADKVRAVLESLSAQIARDGEGARKRVVIHVSGARSNNEAVRIARAIANSPLVKTAIAGSDPNWGRILSAAGASGATFDPRKVSIDLQGVTVCRSGLAALFSESEVKRRLDEPECEIRFAIRGTGGGQARFWTCDLTEKYIEINASYRT
jgi:glutamate N-acetyltransferase/amino-acid N-acetyltransferase